MTLKYYSTTEVAKILRVSRIAVFKQIKTGKLPAEKIGRNYLISQEALVEALGKTIGSNKKKAIEKAIKKALKDYGETFRQLGKE